MESKEIQKQESPNISLLNTKNNQKNSIINTSINNINYAITNNNNNSNILIQDDDDFSPGKNINLNNINSKNNLEKIQQLLESKRILSTLRTIKSNNNTSAIN